MSAWSGGELRRLALDALGEHADERAREALAHAVVNVVSGAARWEGSSGPVEAHRVTIGLDARRLGALRVVPALADAMCAAVANAIATRPREALLDVDLRWNAGVAPAEPDGYRGAAPHPAPTLRDALVDYLDASGEPDLAQAVDAVEPAASGRDVGVRMKRPDDARARGVITRAVRDLLGDDKVQVRVRS